MMAASLALAASLVGVLASVPLPLRLTADVDDAYALRENPAGLGVLRATELRLVFGHLGIDGGDGGVNGFGVFGAANLFGSPLTIAGSWDVDLLSGAPDPQHSALGFGLGGAAGGIGFSFDHLKLGSLSRDFVTAGLTLRPASWLSAAFVARDLAEDLGARTYDLGLAVRPGTDRVLLSARWRLTDGTEVFGAKQDLAFRAEVEPVDGLFLGGGATWVHDAAGGELGLLAQVRVALETLSIGGTIRDDTRSTGYAAEVALRSRPIPSTLTRDKVATLHLSGDLTPDPSFRLLAGGFTSAPYGAVPLLLDELARADHVAGVFLHIGSLQLGWGRAVEVRDRILAIRAAGRRVDCQLSGSGDLEYFLASACSSIFVAPAATLEVNGVAASVLYIADALRKVGVDVAVERRGEYKSAPEALTRMGMSPAQKEALGAYLDRVYETLVDGVSSGRGLPRAEVERIIAQGTLTATEAVALKLVDRAVYPDQVEAEVDRLYGTHVSYADAVRVVSPARTPWSGRTKIAVIHVDATIAGGSSKSAPFGGAISGAGTIVGALEAARKDSNVAAVVLRVDSPGGDAFASDLIAREVKLTDEVKPVIVSFGDTAASGGYYVAANARVIYAEPTTLTGSIGVFSVKVSIDELLGKLGLASEALARGPLADEGSVLRPITPASRALMARGVDVAYRAFLEVVAKGRKKSVEDVRALAEGRIWSGQAAKERGLVDELGGLTDAVARARAEAGVADEVVELVTLPEGRGELPLPVRVVEAAAEVAGLQAPAVRLEDLVPHEVARALAPFVAAAGVGAADRPLALVPFVLEVD